MTKTKTKAKAKARKVKPNEGRRVLDSEPVEGGWSAVDDGCAHFYLNLEILDGRWRRGIGSEIVETELRKVLDKSTEMVKLALEEVIEAHSPRKEKPKVVPGMP